MSTHSGCPDNQNGADEIAAVELESTFGVSDDLRVHAQFNFALCQFFPRILTEIFPEFRQNIWNQINKHDTHHFFFQVRVVLQCIAHKVV